MQIDFTILQFSLPRSSSASLIGCLIVLMNFTVSRAMANLCQVKMSDPGDPEVTNVAQLVPTGMKTFPENLRTDGVGKGGGVQGVVVKVGRPCGRCNCLRSRSACVWAGIDCRLQGLPLKHLHLGRPADSTAVYTNFHTYTSHKADQRQFQRIWNSWCADTARINIIVGIFFFSSILISNVHGIHTDTRQVDEFGVPVLILVLLAK